MGLPIHDPSQSHFRLNDCPHVHQSHATRYRHNSTMDENRFEQYRYDPNEPYRFWDAPPGTITNEIRRWWSIQGIPDLQAFMAVNSHLLKDGVDVETFTGRLDAVHRIRSLERFISYVQQWDEEVLSTLHWCGIKRFKMHNLKQRVYWANIKSWVLSDVRSYSRRRLTRLGITYTSIWTSNNPITDA